jgi:AraC-like DNA-binding protein
MTSTRTSSEGAWALERLVADAERLVPDAPDDPLVATPLAGVTLLRARTPTTAEGSIYRPVVCLILRGQKETRFAGDTVPVRTGQVLLVSHHLPIVARVLEAPYLALVFELDLGTLRSLYDEVGDALPEGNGATALRVCEAEVSLLDALRRCLALAHAPTDDRVLGAMVRREVHYRLLVAPFGGMLRHLLRHDSHASAIARAITSLQRDFRGPVGVPRLAREVGMSVSAFHKHFKEVTSSSPLQYQKALRLLEARRRLRAGTGSVTEVAFEVGYESATQFSREYARKFGKPPSRDAKRPGG